MKLATLITIQGSARGGKGTLTHALQRDLAQNYSVHTIDQGLKFRILAAAALEQNIDREDLDALAAFIARDDTRDFVAAKLVELAEWPKEQITAVYYTEAISNASGMVGKLPVAHDVVVQLLLGEVRALAVDYEIILVDGRALQGYGKQLAAEGVVRYLLAIDVHCDAFISAQRETKIFAPDDGVAEDYTRDEAMRLLIATRDIARRNASDARRQRDPSLPIPGAYDFDVLHGMNDVDIRQTYDEVKQNGAIMIDNSNTRTVDSLTAPVISLVRYLLQN